MTTRRKLLKASKTKNRTLAPARTSKAKKHELASFRPCSFGDGGFMYHEGADRAVCSCGWLSAAVQRDKKTLVMLWEIHKKDHDEKV